jgi:hypothetical protein
MSTTAHSAFDDYKQARRYAVGHSDRHRHEPPENRSVAWKIE